MPRQCPVTGKATATGNNRSHANNKTRRKFFPNLQNASFFSDKLQRKFSFRLTTRGIRTIEHRGGLDSYVMSIAKTKLAKEFKPVRKALLRAERKAAA